MITRPLDLQSRLKAPSKRLNPVPLFDVLLIAFFFSLLSSKFVLSPGLTINLPQGGSGLGAPVSAVLKVEGADMLLFDGRILNMESLGAALRTHTMTNPGETNLLIYFNRDVSVQTLLSVAEVAREEGVARVQLAAEPRDDGNDAEEAFFR
jgi:biopolymer transport protein ExbD